MHLTLKKEATRPAGANFSNNKLSSILFSRSSMMKAAQALADEVPG